MAIEGHFVLYPRLFEKGVGFPLMRMEVDVVVTQDIIKFIRGCGKFNYWSENLIKDHSKRSIF